MISDLLPLCVCVTLFIYWIPGISGQNCLGNRVGPNPGVTNADPPQLWNHVVQVNYPVPCDGVISAWHYTRALGGACETIEFVVWRQVTGNDYEFIGRNTHAAAYCADYIDTAVITFGVAPRNRIPVQANDLIGIYSTLPLPNNYMIAKRDTGPGAVHVSTLCPSPADGVTCTLALVTMDIAFSATVIAGEAPHIDNLDSEVSVYENDPGAIFTVIAHHSVNMNPDPATGVDNEIIGDPVDVTYSVNPSMFTIGATDGVINAPGLNYEATPNQFTIDVTVRAMNQDTSRQLIVNVIDINEAHMISNIAAGDQINVVVDGTLKDTEIFEVRVNDPDAGNANPSTIYFSMLEYELENPALPANTGPRPPFRIDALTGKIYTSMDMIDFVYEPCCENPVLYRLRIHANDGQFDDSADLRVNIINVRRWPEITNVPGLTPPEVSFREDFVGGSPIFGLESTGPSPTNIRYSILFVDPVAAWHIYSVNEITGDVNMMANPQLDVTQTVNQDALTRGDHEITLAITDGVLDGPTVVLTVEITWANTPPRFQQREYFVTIPEKCGDTTPLAPCGGFLLPPWPLGGIGPISPGPIIVDDREVHNTPTIGGDSLVCSIRIGDGSGFFTINPGTPVTSTTPCDNIFVISVIDVDTFAHYKQINLTLQVQDLGGGGAAGDTADLYITVADINDNVPTFDSPTYDAEIEENTRGGVSILTVFAEDQPLSDSGAYAEVTYGIVNALGLPPAEVPSIDPIDFFQVDPQAGVLSTKQPIDYEAIYPKFIVFDIQAIDNGGNSVAQSSLTRINITILDVNDNRPEWDCSNRPDDEPYDWNATCFYNLELRDDINIGYMVQQLKATDVDTVSPTVTFFLLKPNSYFMLTKDFGEVFVKWDLETYTRYILYCFAQDNGNPNLMTHITWVRIDTFPPRWHLVDITLNIPRSSFNDTVTQQVFIDDLRAFFASKGKTWWAKWERITGDRDKTTVTIYALEDTSTYYQQNLHLPKKFVHRDDLLRVLRHNIRGVPRDELVGALTYTPIKVMPTYINWFLDTIEGIITLTFLCLIALALLIFLIVIVMKKLRLGCFKEKPKQTKKAWPEQDGYANPLTETEMQEVKQSSPTGDDDSLRQRGSTRAETREARRPSLESIHSAIVRPSYDPFM